LLKEEKRQVEVEVEVLLCFDEEEKGPKRLGTGIFILGSD